MNMKKPAWIAGLLLAAVGLALAQDLRPPRRDAGTELVFFFSDSAPDLEASALALRGLRAKHLDLRIKPVFLVEDFASIANPSAEFASGIRELRYAVGQDFAAPVYDEAGLALARKLKLDRLPAYALVNGQRAFVACGTRANLEELLRCGN
jgi:hypothetical protein